MFVPCNLNYSQNKVIRLAYAKCFSTKVINAHYILILYSTLVERAAIKDRKPYYLILFTSQKAVMFFDKILKTYRTLPEN